MIHPSIGEFAFLDQKAPNIPASGNASDSAYEVVPRLLIARTHVQSMTLT